MAGTKSTTFSTLTAVLVGSASLASAAETAVSAHDPVVFKQGDTFYLFATGRGLPMHSSKDLVHWTRLDNVLPTLPGWAKAAHPKANDVWAPDISFTNGEYRLYYAVSSFGTSESTIGLLTNTTLNPADASYKWVDRGPILATKKGDDWNAIDPAAFTDADGQTWLAAGSYWTGIKLFKVDAGTGKIVAGDKPRSIARRPGKNTAIEAPFISRHDGYYYLWVSFDACCKGADSTYNIRVGRSKSVEGPYVDRDGTPMTDGGGTLVLAGYDNVRGPGHCAVLQDGKTDYLIHHWYDAANNGRRRLGVRTLTWDADGWPKPGPLLAPTPQPATTQGG